MSRLAQLQGKGKTFNIGGIDIPLKPLSIDDLKLLSIDDNAPMKEQVEMTNKLISKVLKEAIPDATDEEIKNISLEHLTDLMNAIMELNKIDKSNIKNVLGKRQTG